MFSLCSSQFNRKIEQSKNMMPVKPGSAPDMGEGVQDIRI